MNSLDVTYRKFSSRGVDGRDAQRWMGRPELAEYSFWVINRDDETAWSYGPNKGY
jgi:thiamine biosynthesis lipoprotein